MSTRTLDQASRVAWNWAEAVWGPNPGTQGQTEAVRGPEVPILACQANRGNAGLQSPDLNMWEKRGAALAGLNSSVQGPVKATGSLIQVCGLNSGTQGLIQYQSSGSHSH